MIDFGFIAGRYGAYIWPAYGLSLIGLAVMALDTALRSHRWRRETDRLAKSLSPIEADES